MFKIFLFIILILNNFLSANDKVILKLDWLHQFQFAGYYMAKEKGFYEEVNLDVQIDEFNFSTDQIADVLNQNSTYAVGKSSLIIDALSGKELIMTSAIFQHSPMVLVTTNPNIKQPQDLYNKNIMLTPDARTAVAINSMISSQGVKLNDVNFQEHSFKLEDLIDGKTDAMGSYLSNEPYLLEQRGIKYNVLDPKEFGFDFYGGILFTSKRELLNNPTRVQNFDTASLRGWKYAFNNINETVELIYKKYNTQNKSIKALTFEANTLKELSDINNNNLGNIELSKVKEMVKIYSLLGYKLNIDLISDIIIDPKKVLLSQAEKSLLKNEEFKFVTNKSTFIEVEKDYLELLTKKLGLKYSLIDAPTKKIADKLLLDKKADFKISMGFNNVIPKKDKKNKIFANYNIVIATLNEYQNFIYDISLLNNKKVAISSNTIDINKIQKIFPKIMFIQTKDSDSALKLLDNKKVIAVFDSILKIKNAIVRNNFNNIKISGNTEFYSYYYFQTNSENQTLNSIINKTIDKLDKEELSIIKEKNTFINYITKTDNSLFLKIGIPLLLLTFFVFLVNLRLRKEILKNKKAENTLRELSETDTLTQIYNRRKITKLISEQIKISTRYKRDLSVIFFDIDNFKLINDNFGHHTGDDVLKEFTKIVKENLRDVDAFGRWGGEEFIIVLPETPKSALDNILNKIQEAIENFEFTDVKVVTCSFGATTLIKGEDDNTFINRADKAMYHIKKTGKNGYSIA